ncbi:MAG: peptidylprolyl isomerase [Patescibacteria group bacterium]|jgi:parvulin-like peptidyl-prolyl isomerase
MKEKLINWARACVWAVKNFGLRLKPRGELKWIITFILWLLLVVYLGFGVFVGVAVYQEHADTSIVRMAVKIYPLPAAFVNGDIVWVKEYYQQMSYIKQYDAKTNAVFSEPQVRSQVMAQLIENHLIQWQAAKDGLTVSSKDVNDAYQKIVSQQGETQVKKVINELYGMNVNDFKALIKTEVLKEKVQDQLIAQIKVVHIFVTDESQANEVANQAKSGGDFATLAKTYSEDVKTRDNGGDLGWIARGDLIVNGKTEPEFETVAFGAKIGEVFGPIKTSVGYEIARVDGKKGKVQESYNDWVTNAEKNAKVIHFLK